MDKKISIYDIADYLNISAATVSYVINGVPKVSEKTKEKVLNAIKELGYVPNYAARALSTGKSELIGVLLPLTDVSIGFVQNPFYSEFIAGFEEGISSHNYDVVIGAINNIDDVDIWVKSRDLAGVVIIGSLKDEILEQLKKLTIPIVLIDNYSASSEEFNSVKSDVYKGTYLATKYLIEKGHQRIGFAGNPYKYPIDNLRFSGFLKALNENNLAFDEVNLFIADATYSDGYQVADLVFANSQVKALVCAGDMLAIGILKKALELHKNIPADLSIVGYDDIFNSRLTYPSLTTVRQHIGLKGQKAADIIMNVIENGQEGPVILNLEPELIERDSVI